MSRVHAQLADPEPTGTLEKDYCPVLVVRNTTRFTLQLQRSKAICDSIIDDHDLPILIFAHMCTRKNEPVLTTNEKSYLRGLPDSDFDKVPPFLILYPGAWCLITTNLNVDCGLAQGTRCQLIGWPVFPSHNIFHIEIFNGMRVRRPSHDLLCAFFLVTSTLMKHKPQSQPENLPANVVALSMYKHKPTYVDVSGSEDSCRKSVSIQMTQLPVRPADVITSYIAQSASFSRLVIFETTPSEFYTQISRINRDIRSLSIACSFSDKFKPRNSY